ncbi:MAG: acetylornithine transaminase [Nitrospiria bacterium]
MGEQTNNWIIEGDRVLMPTYARFPLVLTRGAGATLWDADGNSYLDFVSGIAVNALGHCDAALTDAVQEQAETLLHVSNLYYNLPQIELAKRLVEHSFADKVFFCNSGAEAVEAAIKLARLYAHEKMDGERFEIITAEHSFHGRTLAALSATGQTKYQEGFEPLASGFKHVPFNDAAAIENAVGPHTAAVMIEPLQGEGGVRVPAPGYLADVRKICDRHGLLLIFDEVQTGIGRTGHLFAYQDEGTAPDILTAAKGLGGGLPIGALLAKNAVAQSFQPGTHASTFGGNPLVCRAGMVVIDRLTQTPLLKEVREHGANLLARLSALRARTKRISDLRGKGLMIAMDLAIPALSVIEAAMKQGLLLNCTSEYTLRLIPPLIVQAEEIDRMLAILSDILMEPPDAKA